MRPTSPLLIHIDMISALRDGISFQLASNGAVLTAGEDGKGILPLKYVRKVEERKSGQVIWRREGGEEDTGEKA
jgi:RNA:NAD 2'-phosphotransferase (TPT1/KptA family)